MTFSNGVKSTSSNNGSPCKESCTLPVIYEADSFSSTDGSCSSDMMNDTEQQHSAVVSSASTSASTMMISQQLCNNKPKKTILNNECTNRNGQAQKTKMNYIIMALLFVGVFIRPYRYINPSMTSTNGVVSKHSPTLFGKRKRRWHEAQLNIEHTALDIGDVPDSKFVEQMTNEKEDDGNRSYAPLFYHISPGSTGSRTLYHAA